MNRLAAVFSAALLLTACPSTKPTPDGGVDAGAPAPHVTTILPSSGPLAGGTLVQITGANFEEGVKVFFGAMEADNVTLIAKNRLSAKTPASTLPGPVDVKVQNADGQSDALTGGYTYEAKQISEAVLKNAATQSVETAQAAAAVQVTAEVTASGLTDGQGAGAGIKAQVGYGPEDSDPTGANWNWTDAAYSADTGASQESDAYAGTVSVPGPTSSSDVTWSLAARFSTDDGATWVVADRDGSSNGTSISQLAKVTVTKPQVGWCKLGGVTVQTEAVNIRSNQSGPTIYGQVYVENVTPQSGAPANVTGQLGYGAPNTDPTTWTWVDATWNADKAPSNDEFKAQLPNPGLGTYKYAYRFSLAGGAYKYCDGNGSDDGFTEANAGTLTVLDTQVDRCVLQYPAKMVQTTGSQTQLVYGRIAAAGVTDSTGAPSGLTAELGYGAPGTAPSTWTSWTAATFNVDVDGTTDEFQASFATPAAGSYRYAYRFKIGTGSYSYCDLDGSDVGGYTDAQAGVLDVPTFTDCKLLAPSSSTIGSGDALVLKARVYGNGVTTTTGANAGIKAQIGIGAPGSDARSSTLWGWGDATFAADVTGATDNGWDEYGVTAHPAYNGARLVAARFSSDNGQTWLYCDLDKWSTGGFDPAQQASLTVNTTSDLDYCILKYPPTTPTGTAATAYGQVMEPSVTGTQSGSTGAGITAELGYGPEPEDPGISSKWTWVSGAFNSTCSTCGTANDEYSASLPASLPAGTSYAWRFVRVGGSGAMCFGDLNGNGANTGLSGSDYAFSGKNSSQDNLGLVVP